MKMEFSAGGIVYRKINHQFEFAIILDPYNEWTFPKGHIEKGEKPEAAALREIQEEIGLSKLKIIKLLEKTDYWFKFEEKLIHKYVYFYLIEVTGDEELVRQVSEVQAAEWVNENDIMAKIGYPKQNHILLSYAFNELGISK